MTSGRKYFQTIHPINVQNIQGTYRKIKKSNNLIKKWKNDLKQSFSKRKCTNSQQAYFKNAQYQ